MRGRWIKGSMTVEAAMVIPMMFFVAAAFLKIFFLLHTEFDMQTALQTCLNEYCCLSIISEECQDRVFVSEQLQGLSDHWGIYHQLWENERATGENGEAASETEGLVPIILREWIRLRCGKEQLSQNLVLDGQGMFVSVTEQEYRGHTYLQANLSYYLKLIVLPGYIWRPYVLQRANCSRWQGRSYETYEDEAEAVYVYYTEYGSVYHTSVACKYLNIAAYQIPAGNIQEVRNNNGGKYYPCEYCIIEGETDTGYYVTSYGTAYHSTISCGMISRDINRVLREDTDLPMCSECRQRDEQ